MNLTPEMEPYLPRFTTLWKLLKSCGLAVISRMPLERLIMPCSIRLRPFLKLTISKWLNTPQ